MTVQEKIHAETINSSLILFFNNERVLFFARASCITLTLLFYTVWIGNRRQENSGSAAMPSLAQVSKKYISIKEHKINENPCSFFNCK